MCGIFSRENPGQSLVISTDPEEIGKEVKGLQKGPQMSRNFTVNGLLQLPRLLLLNPRPQTVLKEPQCPSCRCLLRTD
ncbi:hypothetical protein J1605_005832 [Eschrichtius robustus]|uniref:Uncharacterized protein n=1 Tax=Eschrichtius robustus TaxID=9764 RepID=A0AB34H6F8_ESCRO|nr:hypothetical protein J1605_005832 [Eschrichtius robustus]